MYEHNLDPNLLPSYAQVDYVYHEAILRIKQEFGAEPFASRDLDWDVWYNSTKVTGIRTLRFRIFDQDQATTDRFINAVIGLLKPLHPDSWQTFSYCTSHYTPKDDITAEDAAFMERTWRPWRTRKDLYNVTRSGKDNVIMIYYRSNKVGEKVPFEQLHPREQRYRTIRKRRDQVVRAFRKQLVGKTLRLNDNIADWRLSRMAMGKQYQGTEVEVVRHISQGSGYAPKFEVKTPQGRHFIVNDLDLKGTCPPNLYDEAKQPYIYCKTDEFPTFA